VADRIRYQHAKSLVEWCKLTHQFMREQNITIIREACIKANLDKECANEDDDNYCPQHTIHLADVLLAMTHILNRPGDWIIDTGGQFWEIIGQSSEGDWVTKPHSVRWQLVADTLDEQSDECLAFLAELCAPGKFADAKLA
jgi:hypothetical protein